MTNEIIFDNVLMKGLIRRVDDVVQIDVTINAQLASSSVRFWAAAPRERRASFTGSGLPFPNKTIAFQNTPNTKHMTVDLNFPKISVEVLSPNAYYDGDTFVPPHVDFEYLPIGESSPIVSRVVLEEETIANRRLRNTFQIPKATSIVNTQETRIRQKSEAF
jgi:hypothetical protein